MCLASLIPHMVWPMLFTTGSQSFHNDIMSKAYIPELFSLVDLPLRRLDLLHFILLKLSEFIDGPRHKQFFSDSTATYLR